MQVVLAAHPQLASFQGESALFTWQDLFDRQRHHMNLPADRLETLFETCDDVVDFFDRAAAAVRKQSNASRFVEKTPQHVLKLDFIRRHFPHAQVIHLYRDGRDCCCSARKAGIPHGEEVQTFANYWRRCIRTRGYRGDDPHIYDVQYETLTSEPERSIRGVMRFLGEEFSREQIVSQARSQDRRSDDQMFARLSEEITPRSQGRWKNELSSEEISLFTEIAGEQLYQLGYEV